MAECSLRSSTAVLALLAVFAPWQPWSPRVACAQTAATPASSFAEGPAIANQWTPGCACEPFGERGIIIHSPLEACFQGGYALVPNIELQPGTDPSSPWRPTQISRVWDEDGQAAPAGQGEVLPEPMDDGSGDSVFAEVLRREWSSPLGSRLLSWLWGRGQGYREAGIGAEYVAVAPMEVEITQPLNTFRVRIDSVQNFSPPDRAEYLWARANDVDPAGGRGPDAERSVDYQDLRFQLQTGGEKFSVATEIPIRLVDPVTNGNTAGMGDMSLTTKTVLCDGVRWQITQLFRSYFNTGAPSKGLGNGHISLEPGMLARFKIDDQTYVHSEITYWFPIAGHPEHSGQVLRWGVGVSRVWRDWDSLALIPTFEIVGLSAMDGMETKVVRVAGDEFVATAGDIDSRFAPVAFSGLRAVVDTGGDMGVLEFGFAAGINLGGDGWYDNMLRFEIRRDF